MQLNYQLQITCVVGAKLLNYKLVISNYFQLLELLLTQQNTSYTYDIVN
jgi:hypothetical protein